MATLQSTGFTLKNYTPFPYSGSQAVLLSDRIHLHAKSDSVLLFGSKSIGLSSQDSIHLNSKEYTVINSPVIRLGLKAQSPVILGDKFIEELREFLVQLGAVANMLSGAATRDGSGKVTVADPGKIISAGSYMASATDKFSKQLDSLLSTKTYVE
jgi:hypothetical protein